MKKFINKLINHPHLLPFLLFTFIFTAYFSSSVGLINSGDTPQYFTTEALIQFNDLNISHFQNDPHNFSYPDIYFRNDQTLGVRGYLLSFFSAPLHFFSHSIKHFFRTDNFPKEISRVQNFKYELSVVSFYSFFPTIGLIILWQVVVGIIKNKKISSVLIIFLAFGSFIWKYSTFYSRQNLVIFLISLSIFFTWKICENKRRRKNWVFLFLIIWGGSFGIDLILFIAFSVLLIILIFNYIIDDYWKSKKKLLQIKVVLLLLSPSILIIFIQIILNYYWYGTFWFSQTNLQPHVKSVLLDRANSAWVSTPLFPTIFVALFNYGQIPNTAFKNFDSFPQQIAFFSSLEYAKKYNFFGIFSITPVLFFSFFSFFLLNRKILSFILLSVILFLIGITGNSKVLNFWGGNQYDVRYFYPYIILLAVPTALGLQYIIGLKNKIIKTISLFIFGIFGIFSIFMGWLGVLQMYKPALTGERKIWIDLFNAFSELPRHSFQELLDATFMNRENAWIAIVLSFIFYFLLRLILILFKKIHYEKQIS